MSKYMKYKINTDVILKDRFTSEEDLLMSHSDASRAILAIIVAGDICLTQEGYDKLDSSLKALFIAESDQPHPHKSK